METRIYTAYDPPPAGGTVNHQPSLTRQSEKDACDVNKIVAQYDRTGALPQTGQEGLYLDVTTYPDFRQARDAINLAEGFFAALPASTRARFDNDAARFLDFCADPNNRTEVEQMGILPTTAAPKEPPPPTPAPAGEKTEPPTA